MGSHLEYAVEYEGPAFEKDIAPVPAVVLDNPVRFGFDPEVKDNEGNATDPT